ncbi:Golgi phosphoprotein 3 (GPP34) [Desulfonatronum thiosulfatophilum]|uniref:Golgi phosphoprotein 3 (GPP34) n=2 Tax=Desulfonatronum thiosulfatophilum TaxID=617002 RepID=A0A1G6A3Q5_9BACT|nr:Golgi phosphoprotein 3 (GPP34) [Desulfonatronum thiosulfatophilum]
MLTFAEEILLLTLDDKKGDFRPLHEQAMRTALAGALLMDLAMADRIDTDLQHLFVINTDPVGDPLLDETLGRLRAVQDRQNAAYWLNEIAWQTENLRPRVLQRLVDRGVLKVEDRKILWVFAQRRYPLIDDREVKEVRARLRELIFNKEIPDAREAVLIGLVHACGMIDTLFEEHELPQVMPRVMEVARLDLIGREVDRAIRDIFMAMTSYNVHTIAE